MELFDTHAHYNDERFNEDRHQIIEQIYQEGVTHIINAGYSLESSKKAIKIAENYNFMDVIIGISPNDVSNKEQEIEDEIKQIEKLAQNKKVLAIGEIGLDYYWNKENKKLQKFAFVMQVELANKLNLPIVIHTREAVEDTIYILKHEAKPIKPGIFHCCPLNRELVKEALKLGFYISFAGPITFKNSKNANEIIQMVPFDKILIETDSPYLSPEPNRGKRNDSRNVKYIAEKIAEVKELSLEEIANITYQNAKKVFEC